MRSRGEQTYNARTPLLACRNPVGGVDVPFPLTKSDPVSRALFNKMPFCGLACSHVLLEKMVHRNGGAPSRTNKLLWARRLG